MRRFWQNLVADDSVSPGGEAMTARDADRSAEMRGTKPRFDRYVLDIDRGCLLLELEGNEIALSDGLPAAAPFTGWVNASMIQK
jgi:hypothetical protein